MFPRQFWAGAALTRADHMGCCCFFLSPPPSGGHRFGYILTLAKHCSSLLLFLTQHTGEACEVVWGECLFLGPRSVQLWSQFSSQSTREERRNTGTRLVVGIYTSSK